MALQPGDSLSLSREGKVFLNQFSSVSAFVSLTRVLGDDPEADVEVMREDLDHMFHEQLLINLAGVSQAYDAMGGDENDPENVVRLAEYLEKKKDRRGTEGSATKRRKRIQGA